MNRWNQSGENNYDLIRQTNYIVARGACFEKFLMPARIEAYQATKRRSRQRRHRHHPCRVGSEGCTKATAGGWQRGEEKRGAG